MLKLFKDGDRMGILTDLKDEKMFTEQLAGIIAELIEKGAFKNDWLFQLERWLSNYAEIICSMRGYKANVETIIETYAGAIYPSSASLATINDKGLITYQDETLFLPIEKINDRNWNEEQRKEYHEKIIKTDIAT